MLHLPIDHRPPLSLFSTGCRGCWAQRRRAGARPRGRARGQTFWRTAAPRCRRGRRPVAGKGGGCDRKSVGGGGRGARGGRREAKALKERPRKVALARPLRRSGEPSQPNPPPFNVSPRGRSQRQRGTRSRAPWALHVGAGRRTQPPFWVGTRERGERWSERRRRKIQRCSGARSDPSTPSLITAPPPTSQCVPWPPPPGLLARALCQRASYAAPPPGARPPADGAKSARRAWSGMSVGCDGGGGGGGGGLLSRRGKHGH